MGSLGASLSGCVHRVDGHHHRRRRSLFQVEVRNSLRYMIDESSTRGNYYYDTREIFGSDNVMLLGIEDDQLLTG